MPIDLDLKSAIFMVLACEMPYKGVAREDDLWDVAGHVATEVAVWLSEAYNAGLGDGRARGPATQPTGLPEESFDEWAARHPRER